MIKTLYKSNARFSLSILVGLALSGSMVVALGAGTVSGQTVGGNPDITLAGDPYPVGTAWELCYRDNFSLSRSSPALHEREGVEDGSRVIVVVRPAIYRLMAIGYEGSIPDSAACRGGSVTLSHNTSRDHIDFRIYYHRHIPDNYVSWLHIGYNVGTSVPSLALLERFVRKFECAALGVRGQVRQYSVSHARVEHSSTNGYRVELFFSYDSQDLFDGPVTASTGQPFVVEVRKHNEPASVLLRDYNGRTKTITSCPHKASLVGLEISQGTQDWEGSVQLVKNRKTAVRAFFTTDEDTVEVTASLQAKTPSGRVLGVVKPISRQSLVLNKGDCDPADDESIIRCREDVTTSLNFILRPAWTARDDLRLELIGFPQSLNVTCKEQIKDKDDAVGATPTEDCGATVGLTEVNAPTIVMIPVPVQVPIEEDAQLPTEDTEYEVVTPTQEMLITQFNRIIAMMPIPNQQALTNEGAVFFDSSAFKIYDILSYKLEVRRGQGAIIFLPEDGFNIGNSGNGHIILAYWLAALREDAAFASRHSSILLGVVSGESNNNGGIAVINLQDRDRQNFQEYRDNFAQRGYANASFSTSGIDEDSNNRTSYFGTHRNTGSHELGHVLGQPHTRKIAGISDYYSTEKYGFCSEVPENSIQEIYPYGGDPYPDDDGFPPLAGYITNNSELPLLGPMGDANQEVWGLDVSYLEEIMQNNQGYLSLISSIGRQIPNLDEATEGFLARNYFLRSLVTSNPRDVYSIMSYCHPEGDVQSSWMDKYHHQEIIDFIQQASGTDGVAEAGASGQQSVTAVASDLFTGLLKFSAADNSVSGVELGRVYSRPRQPAPTTSGDYVLELRDSSGMSVRQVAFSPSAGIPVPPSESSDAASAVGGAALFTVAVANPPAYSSYAIKQGSTELVVKQRSANAPSVSVVGVTAGQAFSQADTIELMLTGTDADNDALSYRVYYSTDGGGTYLPVILETTDAAISLEASKLDGSDTARLGVSVSDGTRSVFVETPVFKMAGHAPGVEIKIPVTGTAFAFGQGLVLKAAGYDKEDGLLGDRAFSWSSSLDGNLGSGSTVVLATDDLTAGSHTITVTATDTSGLSAAATATITVNDVNSVPVAAPDMATAALSGATYIDVLANDIDTEGDINSFKITQQPVLGEAELSVSPEGVVAVRYVPHTSGYDSLEYEICDGISRCSAALVSLTVGLEACTVLGTEADDRLMGTSADDVICGLGGNDYIDGRSGNDIILGGAGNDQLYGRAGHDTIRGGLGDDYVIGHRGDDTIYGGPGNDEVHSSDGNDTIMGGPGDDTLQGYAGDDTIAGGPGADTINGGRDDDTIRGGPGSDTIRGNSGVDTIYRQLGIDTILGEVASDTYLDDTSVAAS